MTATNKIDAIKKLRVHIQETCNVTVGLKEAKDFIDPIWTEVKLVQATELRVQLRKLYDLGHTKSDILSMVDSVFPIYS